MADCNRGYSRREGPVRPSRAWGRGPRESREGGEQEPMVPASQGDGIASRWGRPRIRRTPGEPRRERSLEEAPGDTAV